MREIVGLGFAAAFLYFFGKKKGGPVPGNEDVDTPPPPSIDPQTIPAPQPEAGDMKAALRAVIEHDQSPAIARLVEKIYRLETAHFTSKLYQATNAAGQKAVTKEFPFGWKARGTVASDYLPPVWMVDTGEGKGSWWVAYKRLPVAVGVLAQVLRDRDANPGAWNSNDHAAQVAYVQKLQGVGTPLADAAWADFKAGK